MAVQGQDQHALALRIVNAQPLTLRALRQGLPQTIELLLEVVHGSAAELLAAPGPPQAAATAPATAPGASAQQVVQGSTGASATGAAQSGAGPSTVAATQQPPVSSPSRLLLGVELVNGATRLPLHTAAVTVTAAAEGGRLLKSR